MGWFPCGHPSRRPLWRAPQDEVLLRAEILDPHGEEPAKAGVSNHEAKHFQPTLEIHPEHQPRLMAFEIDEVEIGARSGRTAPGLHAPA